MDRVKAQTLAWELEFGMAAVADVQRWVNEEIAAAVDPDPELIELGFETRPAEVLSLLHQIGLSSDKVSVGRRLYRRILTSLEATAMTPEQAAVCVVRLGMEGASPSPEAGASWGYFDGAFWMAEAGYDKRDDVVAHLREHLREYAR